jgi:hypothetical protein
MVRGGVLVQWLLRDRDMPADDIDVAFAAPRELLRRQTGARALRTCRSALGAQPK